jgi:hypothetical protein
MTRENVIQESKVEMFPEVAVLVKQGKSYSEIQNITGATYNIIARIKEELGLKPVFKKNKSTASKIDSKQTASLEYENRPAVNINKSESESESESKTETPTPAWEKNLQKGRLMLAEKREKGIAEKEAMNVSNGSGTIQTPNLTIQENVATLPNVSLVINGVGLTINGSTIVTSIDGVEIKAISNPSTITLIVNNIEFTINK